jgi:hypothetical protein
LSICVVVLAGIFAWPFAFPAATDPEAVGIISMYWLIAGLAPGSGESSA